MEEILLRIKEHKAEIKRLKEIIEVREYFLAELEKQL